MIVPGDLHGDDDATALAKIMAAGYNEDAARFVLSCVRGEVNEMDAYASVRDRLAAARVDLD
ncbi:MAG TPA: hypothetical protein VHA73_11685 [Acidimicrobiales bacterium]|nr:hypothetical protein [Acidimicrobiales bacterium]